MAPPLQSTVHNAVPRALMALGILSTVTALAVLAALPSQPPNAGQPRQLPLGYDLFARELGAFQVALLPEARTQQLDTMRQHASTLLPSLLWQLNQPPTPLFAPAAELAADLDAGECVPALLAALNGTVARARGPALRALDRLQPLSDGELAQLAPDAVANESLGLAWLEIVASRSSTECTLAALALLAAPSPRVRERAAAILPDELPAAAVSTLLAMADEPAAGTAALALLDRCPVTPELVQALMERLAAAEPDTQVQLFARWQRLMAQEPVRSLLQRTALGDGPLPVRAAALAALERARDPMPLPESWPQWPPRLRYHAARLCIATGRIEGVPVLIALADDAAGPDEDPTTAAMARFDLSQMAQVAPHTKVAYYREWFATLTEVPTLRTGK